MGYFLLSSIAWSQHCFAVQYGHVEVVSTLIQNGANVNAAAINAYHHNVNLAIKPLTIASLREIEEILIRNGADVNDKKGTVIQYSILHLCM